MAYDLEADVARLKAEGKWTECHEVGHDIDSPENLVCNRCGDNFEEIARALEGKCTCPMTAGGILHQDCPEYSVEYGN